MLLGRLRAFGQIDLAGGQPRAQFFGREVHELQVGAVQRRIRQGLAHADARDLPRCLGALARQQGAEAIAWEVVVVDNNSTDGSADILSRAGGIRVLTEAKQGSYAARNRAVFVVPFRQELADVEALFGSRPSNRSD